jgi:ribosome-interacting GTPase 1
MNLHQAIFHLNPSIVTIRGDVAYDANEQVVSYDLSAAEALVAANAYKEQRASEYPTLADFADAYYWAQKGDNTLMDAYVAKCDDVKTKYPKV